MPKKSSETVLIEAPKSKKPGRNVAPPRQHIKKHVAAIHTSGELSLVERKVVNVLLLNAYDDLLIKSRHTIPLAMLCHGVGWEEGRDLRLLKSALVKIASTALEMDLMDDFGGTWEVGTLLAWAKIENGVCSYEYSSMLAQQLANPEIYAQINVGIQRQFKGGYALTLYENCLRYKKVGSTGWIDLKKLRKLLGAEAETYNDTKRLVGLVIKKAVDEINNVSDITITPEYQREGRKIIAIKFTIADNPQQSIFSTTVEPEHEEIRNSELYKRMVQTHGIGDKLAVQWISLDPNQAQNVVDYVEDRGRKNLVRGSSGGLIRRLIENKANVEKSPFDKELEEKKRKQREESDLAAAKEKEEESAKKTLDGSIKTAIEALTHEELRNYARQYMVDANPSQCKSWDRDKASFTKVTERVAFMTWLRAQIKNELGLD